MNKNETINIRHVMNGYRVEFDYRERNTTKEEFDYNYCEEQYVYTTWDEVVSFVQSHKLETPPAKLV